MRIRLHTGALYQSATVVQKPVLIHYKLQFDYTMMNEVMRLIKQFDCVVVKQEAQLFCQIEIGIPKARITEVQGRLKDLKWKWSS